MDSYKQELHDVPLASPRTSFQGKRHSRVPIIAAFVLICILCILISTMALAIEGLTKKSVEQQDLLDRIAYNHGLTNDTEHDDDAPTLNERFEDLTLKYNLLQSQYSSLSSSISTQNDTITSLFAQLELAN